MPETLFLHDTDRRDTFHCFLGQSWEQSEEGRLQAHAMLMADTIVYHCEASVSGVALLVLFLFSLTVIFVLLPLLIYGEWGRWVSVPLLMMAIVPLPFIPFLYRHFVGRSSLCDCSRTPVQLKNAGEGKIEFQDLLTHDEKPNDHCTCAIILEDPHPAESPVSGVCILDVLPIELLMFILRLVPYTYCGCLMLVCRQFAAAASNDSVFRFWCNEHFQCGHRGRYPSEYVLSWKEHFVSVVQSSRLVRSLSARGISSGSHLALNTRMKSAIQRVVGQSSSDTHEITADGVIATVKALIDHGFDVNVANSSGITALHEACDRGLTAVAELLLDSGADPNAANLEGYTALHFAAWHGQPGLIKLLIEHGACIHAKTKADWTPLHLAARYGTRLEALQLLVALGSDREAETRSGESLNDCLRKNRHSAYKCSVQSLLEPPNTTG